MLKIEELCVNLHPKLNEIVRMRPFKTICILLFTLMLTASCLNGSDSTATLYSDAAINGFSLGTLKQVKHTTAKDGSDSTYTVKVTGGNYKFNIDQLNHRIYNTDSLPVGTDVKHVLCTVTTVSNSVVTILDMEGDTIRVYNSTDSIDFSQPRKFIVHSSDGTGWSEYTVSVNAHQEEAYEMRWQLMDGVTMPTTDQLELPMEGIKQIIGSCATETYALSTDDRLMVWRKGSTQWEEDLLDADSKLLPTDDLALTSYAMPKEDNTLYAVMIGNRSLEQYPQEKTARVWRKIVDNDPYAPLGHWTYMEQSDDDPMALPRLQHLTLVTYDDCMLALGGAGVGGATQAPWMQFYQSRDNGITWKYNKVYQLPEGFDYFATNVTMMVDDDKYLWLFCEGTNQVWRGRLNKLGWEIK